MKPYTFFLLVLCVTLAAASAAADTLYNNGPRDDDQDAWNITSGYVVSDTFTLSVNATVSGFTFSAWLFPGDTLNSAELSFTSQENGGTSYFDQMVTFSASDCAVNAYGYDICEETAAFNGPDMKADTYWVNLQNGQVTNGDPVYWDENSGTGCTSPGCPSQASESAVGTIPSEAFHITGTESSSSGTTPEPGSIMLFGSGILGLAGVVRRKLF